jgi:hypothetical protein
MVFRWIDCLQAGIPVDYAIFVHCGSIGGWHDYSNKLSCGRRRFILIACLANEKSLRLKTTGFLMELALIPSSRRKPGTRLSSMARS